MPPAWIARCGMHSTTSHGAPPHDSRRTSPGKAVRERSDPQCVAQSGAAGGARRPDRRRQHGRGIFLRDLDAIFATAVAEGVGAVRQSVTALIDQVRVSGSPVNEYKVDL